MVRAGGGVLRRRPVSIALRSSATLPDVFDAVQHVAFHRPLRSSAVLAGAIAAVAYFSCECCREPQAMFRIVFLAVIWGGVACYAAIGVRGVWVWKRNRERVLVLGTDRLIFHADGAEASHDWRDVRDICFLPDSVLVACRGETLFVSSLTMHSHAQRRRLRQVLEQRAPLVRHGTPFLRHP